MTEEMYMSKRPKLETIVLQFEKGEDFVLSRQEYITKTGADIPQNISYTKKKSAIAKKAYQYGYDIDVVPEKLIFKKH